MRTKKEIENCISSELTNMVSEAEQGTLTPEEIYSYVSTILIDAQVDSKIVVNVLERDVYGELGKHQAMCIKVNEGW